MSIFGRKTWVDMRQPISVHLLLGAPLIILGLLKIVFETNLKLFRGARSNKTHILVVFRDHDPITPLEKLSEIVAADMRSTIPIVPFDSHFFRQNLANYAQDR